VTPFAETFGGISLIVYLVCGIAALCGFVLLGAAINRFALKRRGFEAWAHTKLLLQFPLLVVDGVIFTFTLGKRRPTLRMTPMRFTTRMTYMKSWNRKRIRRISKVGWERISTTTIFDVAL
jgi:hypothetical protein